MTMALFKMKDKTDECRNYRTISLLNVLKKDFSEIRGRTLLNAFCKNETPFFRTAQDETFQISIFTRSCKHFENKTHIYSCEEKRSDKASDWICCGDCPSVQLCNLQKKTDGA